MIEPHPFRRGTMGIVTVALWMALIAVDLPGAAHAASGLENWRKEAAATRVLAENDVRRAYREAQRLQARLPEDASPADRVWALNILSRVEINLALSELGDAHARQALALAKQHADKVGQGEAYLNLATNAVNRARIDDLVDAATGSMTVLEGVNRPDLQGEAMLRTAMMYRRIGQFDDSVTLCLQAMEVAKRSGNPLALAYAHQCLALSFNQSSHKQEAHDHFVQMRRHAQLANSGILEGYALSNLGEVTASLGDVAGGVSFARESIRLFRDVGTPTGIGQGLFTLAQLLDAQGRHAESTPLLDEAVRIYRQYPQKIGLWYVLNARGDNYRARGNLAAAQDDIEHAYGLAKEIGVSLYLSESAQRLAVFYATKADYRRAYDFFAEAAEMRAKADREKSSERMIQIARRYETAARQREIEELTQRNERQAAELRQHGLQQRWLWTVLGGSILMLAGTALFLFRLRRSHALLQQANTRLQHSQEEIHALNVGLEQRVQARTSELRQQTRYLRTLIDMLPVMAWLKDTESRFLTVNRAVADVAGHPADALIGKTDLDFFPREMAEAYRADDAEIMATRQEKVVEEQITGAKGNIWIETYKAPVMDEDGTLLGTVGVARDITESKAVTQAREAALAEAERLASMRSQFLAQMSHELRTPLNGILGYAQIMRRNETLDERQIEGLNVIQQSGEHLLMLINDILEFAKIDAGRMELNPGDMALDRFLRTIVNIIGIKAEQKRLKFIVDIAPDLPGWIRGDEKRLRQVLLNLLANAVKFTDKGEVRLRVSMPVPDHLHFEISDTGVGIAPEYIERIFQPFEQVGDAHRRAAGTGLGLSISRQLVRLMGGDIKVESELGRGSVFRFEIEARVAEAWQAGPQIEGRVTGYAGPRRRVLVADDVAENRAVLIDMLEPLGFEMLQAVTGRDAVEMAKLHLPDLILMDLVMPEMDGLEATSALRQLPRFAEIPIIAVSASASGKDEETSLTAGMNVFLPKPIELDRLLANIAHVLKLNWTYESQASTESKVERPIIAPPESEMQALHRLALQGNMRDILLMAGRLADMGECYLPFAEQLRTLAKGYQSKAILNFVENYLDQEAGP